MPKKSNKTRSDGRIAVQIYTGTVDGKRKYKTVYGVNQKEAEAKAEEIKRQMYAGLDTSAQDDSFKSWADSWINIKSATVSAGRLTTYKSHLAHLEPLNNAPITKIRTIDIQSIISELAMENPRTHKPTAKKTLIGIKGSAVQIMQLAIDNRVINYNPASAVKITARDSQSERRALTEEEQEWILNTPHRAQIPAMIMLYAGLRRGEAAALEWHDIDLEAATISINKTVEFIKGYPHVKDTGKTKNSIRTVDIPEVLVDFLKVEKKKASSIYVCPNTKGQLMTEASWRRMWSSYLTDLNIKYGDFSKFTNRPKSKFDPKGIPFVIPYFTAHWLRHTYATMLYFAGVDVLTAMYQLGHADIQTTLNIYTHLDKKFKRKSMAKLDEFLKCKSNASQTFSQTQ